MNMKLPEYELKIDPKKKMVVDFVSMVEAPAIESNFIAFSKEFHFDTDDEKMELIGAAMIPNMKIYRNDGGKSSGYNIFFSVDTVRQISQEFLKNGFQWNLNIDHDRNILADSFVSQSYIVDEKKGINAPKGMNVPDGTWIIGCKVLNKEVWKDIKSGKVKGFSVEGLFEMFDKVIEDKTHYSKEEQLLSMISEFNKELEQFLKK